MRALKLLADDAGGSALVPTAGTWYAERIVASDFNIVVFGNGHVGRALVQVLSTCRAQVTWVDEREHDFPADDSGQRDRRRHRRAGRRVDDAPPGSLFLVMTHSHALDFELTARDPRARRFCATSA